ncbi:MAG: DUF1571 domain-containing protein, partial [Aureliella sp.]
MAIVLTGIIFWLGRPESAGSLSGLVSQTRPIATTGDQAGSDASDLVGAPAVASSAAHPLDPALDIARRALAKFNRDVDDYTATLVKRERIAGSLGTEMRMAVKVRTRRSEGGQLVRPLQVYLKVLDPWLARGREVIWTENKNDGKLIAHEGGLKNVMRVSLSPTDTLAMLGNKYPITEIGLAKLMEKLIEKGERDKLAGLCQVTIKDDAEVGGRRCQLIQVTHPERDPRFDFHIAQIFLDTQRQIPLRYAAFLWP